jgi:hypothetical protein
MENAVSMLMGSSKKRKRAKVRSAAGDSGLTRHKTCSKAPIDLDSRASEDDEDYDDDEDDDDDDDSSIDESNTLKLIRKQRRMQEEEEEEGSEPEDDGYPIVHVEQDDYDKHGGDDAYSDEGSPDELSEADEVLHSDALREEAAAIAEELKTTVEREQKDGSASVNLDGPSNAAVDAFKAREARRAAGNIDPALASDGESNYRRLPIIEEGDLADAEVIEDKRWCYACNAVDTSGNKHVQNSRLLRSDLYGLVSNAEFTNVVQTHYNEYIREFRENEADRKPWARTCILAHEEEHNPSALSDTMYSLRVMRHTMKVLDKRMKMQNLSDSSDVMIDGSCLKQFLSLSSAAQKLFIRVDALRETKNDVSK